MNVLTTSTYTFLFTDIEGSTQRWERYPQAMQAALEQHDALLLEAITAHQGRVVKTTGDGVLAVFTSALQAVAAALAAQLALSTAAWGEVGTIRVRMALHTGEAAEREGDYHAPALNRAARLMAVGHGGQILLSRPAYDLVRDQLPADALIRDMGEQRLKDLGRPEHIFQISVPGLESAFPALQTLCRRPHNLPVQATPLVGREVEVARLLAVLRQPAARLVTLTGPGGTGKTRLALQAAAELLEEYADGVFFVPLAPVSDPALVAKTIAQALAVREQGDEQLEDSLGAYLREKRLLLVLDNVEQVVEAPPLVGQLLQGAPGLRVLATSRVVLRVYGEQQFPVPPLALPPVERGQQDMATLIQYAAVALFIQRARLVVPAFTLGNETAPAVAEICVRLDGLPLAIELAAARVKMLSPQALLARLSSRLAVLTGGARDLPSRQRTLRGAIDWSYDMLSAAEQGLFARLSVFVGGWTLAAAEAVCAASEEQDLDIGMDLLDRLDSLVDKSLVHQSEGADGEPRFGLLETIREYAAERLEVTEARETVRDRHLAYYLALAEEAAPLLLGSEQGVWLATLEQEHDNLRAALGWSLERDQTLVEGLRLAVILSPFWESHGHLREGRSWLEQALAASATHDVPPALRAGALNSAGNLAIAQGKYERAGVLYEESLAIRRLLDDTRDVARSLNNIGRMAQVQGDFTQAALKLEESLSIFRGLGDTWGVANTLLNRSLVASDQEDYTRADEMCTECLALFRTLGDTWGIAASLDNLGLGAIGRGDYERAHILFSESLVALHGLGDKLCIAIALDNIASLAHEQGQMSRGARLWSAADRLFQAIGAPRSPTDQAKHERAIAHVRATLGNPAFDAAMAEGRALSMEQAIELALSHDDA